jgi:hypothetical protein
MAQHKYGAGQKVRFTPDRTPTLAPAALTRSSRHFLSPGAFSSIASKRKSMGENALFEKISLIGLRRENAFPR